MIRNSIIYRRIWYIKRRNSRKLYIYFRLLSVVIILMVIAFYAKNNSIPYIIDDTVNKIQNTVQTEIYGVIRDMTGEGEKCVLIIREKSINGKQMLLNTSFERIEAVTGEVSERIRKRLEALETGYIKVPAGALLGNTFLSASGPQISIAYKFCSSIESEVTYEEAGTAADQNENRFILHMKTEIGLTILSEKRLIEVNTDLFVDEQAA